MESGSITILESTRRSNTSLEGSGKGGEGLDEERKGIGIGTEKSTQLAFRWPQDMIVECRKMLGQERLGLKASDTWDGWCLSGHRIRMGVDVQCV